MMRLSLKSLLFLCFLTFVMGSGAHAKEEKTHAQKSLEARQRVELLGFFLKDPSQAEMPQTTLAIEFYNQGVEFYQKKDYEPALIAFQSSLKHNSSNALVYELMGDIYYFQQKIAEAEKNYIQAFELSPRATLKTKLEKVQKEKVIEKGLDTYKEQNFIIKYKGDESKYDGFQLREMLKDTYRVISQSFGVYLKQQIVVLLYDQSEFEELTELPHWAAGVYDGKVRMPAYKTGFSHDELEALSAHEITHAFVAEMSHNRAPVWLNEGLAEFQEAKVRPNNLLVFKAAVKTNTLLTIDELTHHGGLTDIQDSLKVSLFYEQAYHLTAYLVDRYGMFRVKELLGAFSEGKSSDEAIREIFKTSLKRLESEWKETF